MASTTRTAAGTTDGRGRPLVQFLNLSGASPPPPGPFTPLYQLRSRGPLCGRSAHVGSLAALVRLSHEPQHLLSQLALLRDDRPALDSIEGDGASSPIRTALPVERDGHVAPMESRRARCRWPQNTANARDRLIAAQNRSRFPSSTSIGTVTLHASQARQPARRAFAVPAVVPPAEGARVERVVVHDDHETFAVLSGQPVERAWRDRSAGVLQGDAA